MSNSVAPLSFNDFIGTTADEQRWQLYLNSGGVTPPWTEIDLTNNAAGNPTQIVYKNGSSTMLTLNLTYDASGAFITQITTA